MGRTRTHTVGYVAAQPSVQRRRAASGARINGTFGVSPRRVVDWSIIRTMKIATGKVVGGKVVVEGVTLEEGASVTVLAKDDEGGFTLSPEEEAELLISIAEADRGETVSAEEVLAGLARRRR